MKTVTNTDGVLHAWANQTQEHARNRSGSVFFSGTKVYSYGTHYLLGMLHADGKVALINSARYSNTTAEHQSRAQSASMHLITASVPDPSDPEGAVDYLEDQLINQSFDFFSKLKPSDCSINWLKEAVDDFNTLCTALGFADRQLHIPDDHYELMREHIELCNKRTSELSSPEALARKEREREKRQLAKEKAQREKLTTDLADWQSGGRRTESLRELRPQALRVKDGRVETTGGAEVRLTSAKRALTKLKNGALKIGDDIDGFKVLEIGEKTLRIGCHLIKIDEAKRVLEK